MADMVREVEAACAIACGVVSSLPDVRKKAEESVSALGASLDSLQLIQAVLGNSTSDAAVTTCAQALTRLCTEHWNKLSDEMRVQMRNFILQILATKGPSFADFTVKALAVLLCRISKYAWYDEGTVIRNIVADASKFLSVTVHHCLIGLRILNELVTEMNQKNRNRTLTQHRKVAISFRDTSLLEVFEVSLSMLNMCATCAIQTQGLPPAKAAEMDAKILHESLNLLVGCLGYDFLGTSPDESVEENSVLQVPNSWRERVQSGATLRLLFNVYRGCTTGRIPLIIDSAPANHADPIATAIAHQQASQAFAVSTERASHTLEAIAMMISVRRSLFATDADRKRFLTHTVRGVNDILRERAGLLDADCYHQVCRLLSKIKNNFQLTELAKCDGYAEWLGLVADFTQQACSRLEWASNSMHYILSLWAKLVAAVPYVKLESGGSSASGVGGGASGMPGGAADPLMLEAHIPNIVGAYVKGRLDSLVGPNAEEALESLQDMESLEEELEAVGALIRYSYAVNSAVLATIIDPTITEYQQGLAFIQQNASGILQGTVSPDVRSRVRLIECRLAWSVAIIGPVVGHTAMSSVGSMLTGTGGAQPGDEQCDAQLSSRVLNLMNMLDQRLQGGMQMLRGVAPAMARQALELFRPDVRLELAILLFVDYFKRAYISESSGMPSPAPPAPPPTGRTAGASAALLLSSVKPTAAESRDAGMGDGEGGGGGAGGGAAATRYDPTDYAALASTATGRQRTFISMFNSMGLGNHVVVIGVILGKLANNLRYWADSDKVIGASLHVFHDLVFGYTSGKLLLSMDQVSMLLTNHGPESFAFLNIPQNTRHRTKFYTCLARLVFLEEDSERLEPFMAPIVSNLAKLAPAIASGVRTDEVMRALIGAARDLRGVLAAAQSRGAYVSVFELLHPQHLDMFVRALDVFPDTPSVTSPVLKFFAELCLQRGGRISFGSNSPHGILLFRAASQAIMTYGTRVLPFQPTADAYKLKYKGVMLAASVLNRCLDGAFVNFGVFALYGDQSADRALHMVFDLACSVPPGELFTHPKLATQLTLLLHFVCRSHMDSLTALPPAQFSHFTNLLRQGLDHVDPEVNVQAACALDYVATAYVKKARKDAPGAVALRRQVGAIPGLFESLMTMLFQIVVFNESSAQWSVMRGLLPAILAAEMTTKEALEVYKADLVSSQPASLQPRMADEFNKLCADVTRSLDMSNRDRFAQRLAMFRTTVREFAAV